MCEGHYDYLTDESPRGDTVFLPAEGPELEALVEKVALVLASFRAVDYCHATPDDTDQARAAIEALRGK